MDLSDKPGGFGLYAAPPIVGGTSRSVDPLALTSPSPSYSASAASLAEVKGHNRSPIDYATNVKDKNLPLLSYHGGSLPPSSRDYNGGATTATAFQPFRPSLSSQMTPPASTAEQVATPTPSYYPPPIPTNADIYSAAGGGSDYRLKRLVGDALVKIQANFLLHGNIFFNRSLNFLVSYSIPVQISPFFNGKSNC